jgi:hypothetical protein
MSGWTPIHDAGEIVGEYVRRHLGGYRLVLLGLRMGSYWIGGPTTSMLYFLASARSVSASAPCRSSNIFSAPLASAVSTQPLRKRQGPFWRLLGASVSSVWKNPPEIGVAGHGKISGILAQGFVRKKECFY